MLSAPSEPRRSTLYKIVNSLDLSELDAKVVLEWSISRDERWNVLFTDRSQKIKKE